VILAAQKMQGHNGRAAIVKKNEIARMRMQTANRLEQSMRGAIVIALTVFSATAAFAETTNFDSDKLGSLPAGWICGVTGRFLAR
jgi:hypothetical protein